MKNAQKFGAIQVTSFSLTALFLFGHNVYVDSDNQH